MEGRRVSELMGFLTSKMGVFQGLVLAGNETLSFVIFCYGLYTLKGLFSYGVLIDSRMGFLGVYLNL